MVICSLPVDKRAARMLLLTFVACQFIVKHTASWKNRKEKGAPEHVESEYSIREIHLRINLPFWSDKVMIDLHCLVFQLYFNLSLAHGQWAHSTWSSCCQCSESITSLTLSSVTLLWLCPIIMGSKLFETLLFQSVRARFSNNVYGVAITSLLYTCSSGYIKFTADFSLDVCFLFLSDLSLVSHTRSWVAITFLLYKYIRLIVSVCVRSVFSVLFCLSEVRITKITTMW
jgi:hypothetical protein